MSSKHTIRITVAGVTQFSAATPITTFNEFESLDSIIDRGDNIVARLHMISYNAEGTAHEVNLSLSPAVGSAASLQIPIRLANAATTPTTLNSFLIACGEDGTLVPRQTGLINNATQAPTDPFPTPGASYVLLFSTVGKDDDATITIVYSIGDRLQ